MEIESIVLISRDHVQVLKVVMLQFTIQLFTYKVAAIVCMQNDKLQFVSGLLQFIASAICPLSHHADRFL